MKTICILLASATLALSLIAGAAAQEPKPTPKREAAPPSVEQPKAQPGEATRKPLEAKCQTPHLDLYPKEELQRMTGKARNHYLPPVVPGRMWSQPCKLGLQSPTGLPERS